MQLTLAVRARRGLGAAALAVLTLGLAWYFGQEPALTEASGMTGARAAGVQYWAHNDSGHSAVLFGLDAQLQVRRRIRLPVAFNDPEDMTAFEYDGQRYLLIADVGDNRARRTHAALYWFAEPQAEEVAEVQVLQFQYPDGARDVEAVSVDPQSGYLYLLSKRDDPPRLYRLDFLNGQTQAYPLGTLRTLPPPRPEDLAADPRHGAYSSQPTAMSFHPHGSALIISTYARPYLYLRDPQQSWVQALEQPPVALSAPRLPQTEAVTWANNGDIILLSEGRPAPWTRVVPEPRMWMLPKPRSTP